MQSGRPPKKRQRPERPGTGRPGVSGSGPEPGATSSIDSTEFFQRIGLQWSGLAAILAAVLFFWTWLFVDAREGRSYVALLVLSPEIWIGGWFGDGFGSSQVYPPSGFFDRWPIIMTAGLILLASVGPGSLLVGSLSRFNPKERAEELVLAVGAGLNLASLYVLAGGMAVAGALHQPWWIWLGLLIGLLLLPVAISRTFLRRSSAEGGAELAPAAEKKHSRWPWLSIFALSVPYLLSGVLPPWDFDVREYHLQAPKEWLQRGQIEFLPHNVYANMPLGVELHAITATSILGSGDEAWWLGGLTAKLLTALYGPLTAALLFIIGRRSGNVTIGLIAAICYLSLPWVAHVSFNGLNDAVLGFYLLACWWVWLRNEAGDWRCLLLAGFFAGGAAAIKYPALIFVVLPLFVETLLRKLGIRGTPKVKYVGPRQFGHAALALVLLLVGFLVGGGLWYAKNARLTGNPVYPLLASRLGGETRTKDKDARWVQAHAVPHDAQGRRFSVAQLATSISTLAIKGDNASPLLLPLALFGCVLAIKRWWQEPRSEDASHRFSLLAIALSLFVFAAWFLVTHRLERFLVPALPLAALLAGFGYVYVKEQAGSTIARGFLAVGLVYCWMFILQFGTVADTRWFVALSHLRADPLLPAERGQSPPQRLSPAERWLNENLTAEDGVLLLGGARVWDLPGPTQHVNVYYNTCFDDCLFYNWLAGKKKLANFRAEFESRDIKYLCVDWAELRRYLSAGNYGYDRRVTPKGTLQLLTNLEKARLLKHEIQWGEEAEIFPGEAKRPAQVIYRVLTSAEATAAASAAAARQKAANKNIAPTPKAAPPTSASQSRKSEER